MAVDSGVQRHGRRQRRSRIFRNAADAALTRRELKDLGGNVTEEVEARWDDDGTWKKILRALQGEADATGDLDWDAQVDSTIVRAHQAAAGARTGGSTPRPPAGCKASGSPAGA